MNFNKTRQTVTTVAKRMFQNLTQGLPSVQAQSTFRPRPNGKPATPVSGGRRANQK